MKVLHNSISGVFGFMRIVKSSPVILLLLLIFLASSWSLLRPGFFRAHDYIHAARIAEITTALQDGHFPVRWSQNFGFGYGMPLFEFYAPLPFYIGSFFYWLGISAISTVKLIFLISNVGTLLGGYFLGKKLFGKSGGLITSAALTLAPYRAVNLFVRGAVSEAWGIMALPWILYGIIVISQSDSKIQAKTGWLSLVLSLVVLMLSHNLTTLMFVPLSIIFTVLYIYTQWKQQKKYPLISVLSKISLSYLLAAGLSAFYLFPALLEKNYTKIDSILGGYFHYSQHFLYIRQFFQPNWGYGGSEWGPGDGISFFLGFGQLLALLLAGAFFLKQIFRKKIPKQTVMIIGLAGLFGFSLFMTLFKSKLVWDSVFFLSFIQFPWRWMAPAIVFSALLMGFATVFISKKITRFFYAWLMVLVIIISNVFYFRPESFLENPQSLYYTDSTLIRSEMSQILPDYIPVQMSDELVPVKAVVSESENITVLVDRTHQKLVATKFSEPTPLSFAVADFPGWEVEIDGKKAPQTKQVNQIGNIDVQVPAGEHLVGVLFGATPVRQISDLISMVSLLILVFVSVKSTYENS